MRCGGASPEDDGPTHLGKMRREKGVKSDGDRAEFLKELICCQIQHTPFGRWRRELSCILGERNLGRIQIYG